MTANAATQNPPAFRMTHVATGAGASTARAAFSGDALLRSGSPPNVTSSLTTAQQNSAPTTIGLPNLTVFDPTATSYVQLPAYFADAEDGAALLKYAITQNTNAALFSFVGIDPISKRLSLKYRVGAAGSAMITVRATDSLGKFVAATFQVVVGYTFTDWASLYPPPGIGDWPVGAAAIYAFGLNPLNPGDMSNAPKMWQQGSVKGLRHLRQRWSSDLQYGYLISPDMVNWTPAELGVHFYEFRDRLANGLDQSDIVFLVDWPRAFVRPQAQIP
jgi:hypothetical protein